jgi:hypothetical protein
VDLAWLTGETTHINVGYDERNDGRSMRASLS